MIYNNAERRKLATIRTLVFFGTGIEGTHRFKVVGYWKAPLNRAFDETYEAGAGSYIAGDNGSSGWFAYPHGEFDKLLPANETQILCDGVRMSFTDWFPARWPTRVTVGPTIMLDGKKAYEVFVDRARCGRHVDYYDEKTLTPIFGDFNKFGVLAFRRDARVVRVPNGLPYPAAHQFAVHGVIAGSFVLTSVRVNVPLDNAMFELPRCWGQCRGGQ